ncbi:MAG: glycoside hydrolase family 3 protein [Propionibacteriaceae bacterium]|jgi:beta-N-acetylhexosaminidase|nr:glycoside hydrolase family 3 protein [Propionibacteriaceae bacterium]
MPNYDSLRKMPYNLDDAGVAWVKDTIASMTKEEKIGQIFCLIAYGNSTAELDVVANKYHAGALMGRPMPIDDVCEMVAHLQTKSKIPMLIAANFEGGGDGLLNEGTNIGPHIQVAATNDAEMAGKQGMVCAKEGVASGANWAFAPIIDLQLNHLNPIIPTRAFGSDPKFVAACGAAYTKAAQQEGMAVSIKHFPGDGVDGRDQHLVTTINTLSCDEWDKTFGAVYQESINAGALTLMAGHISLPAYSKQLRPGIKDENILPATLAPELLNDLLRGKLGFNGMIVSDATSMAGMCIPMPRDKAVPQCIAAGCDMFLFAKNLDEDFAYMTKGVDDGVITPDRLDEAVMRILGVKAALKLPEKKANGTLIPDKEAAKKIVGCAAHKAVELECADRGVTLVKNLDNIVPLDVNSYKRVLLYPINMGVSGFFGGPLDISAMMKESLEKEGFEVDVFEPPKGLEGMLTPFCEIPSKYDLLIYACNLETKSNQTTVRIEWAMPMGANVPIYIATVPTIFISFANPYHLQDVPRVRTFINAYRLKQTNVDAVMDKLLGRSEFKGVSPVDAFCGMWDTRL